MDVNELAYKPMNCTNYVKCYKHGHGSIQPFKDHMAKKLILLGCRLIGDLRHCRTWPQFLICLDPSASWQTPIKMWIQCILKWLCTSFNGRLLILNCLKLLLLITLSLICGPHWKDFSLRMSRVSSPMYAATTKWFILPFQFHKVHESRVPMKRVAKDGSSQFP